MCLKCVVSAIIVCTLWVLNCFANSDTFQSYEMNGGDTINRIDVNNLKQGFWIYFGKDKKIPGYGDGQKVEEGNYIDNRKTGVWKKYFEDGILQNEITYQNSRPNGYAKVYYSNGKLKEEGIWQGNKWVGEYKLYHENGEKYHEFAFNDNGKREGVQKYYYETGKVMIEGEWKEGKESGMVKEYYEDGALKSEKFFNGGALDPASIIVYENEVKEEKPKPEPVGKGVKVEKDEESMSLKEFDGNGYCKLYSRDRQISKDGIFKNNVLVDGKWYKYNKDGILQKIEVYKNGAYAGEAPLPAQ